MKFFAVILATALLCGSASGQVTPSCYGRGECVLSVYLDDSPTTDIDECNDICQSIEFCQDWTLLLDVGLCYSFADCAEFDTDCENCYSGTRSCGDLPCNAPGKCEGGRTLATDVLSSGDDCLALCQATEGCLYYTYDPSDSACIILDNCPDVFSDDCDVCVYGHVLCEEGSGSGTTEPSVTGTTSIGGGGPVDVSAQVRDATTALPLSGASVTVVGGGNTYSGSTDGDGVVLLGPLDVGSAADGYTSKDGYEDLNRTYTIPPNGRLNIALSPEIVQGEFRAVMSWGSLPADLDLHDLIFEQDGSFECEVYYADKECGNVNLDVDNVSGGDNGPETITWSAPDDFIHEVFVYDYTGGSTGLYESGAHVTFFGPDGSTIDVDVPTDDTSGQRYWVVACIDGSVGYSSITVLNYLSFEEPTSICSV